MMDVIAISDYESIPMLLLMYGMFVMTGSMH